MTPNTTRAAIYARISRDKKGEHLGVDAQVKDCKALASAQGWDVVDVYVDNDISAYSGKVRPEYRRLLADLANGKATRVAAWAPDRLHRSPKELEEYIDLSEVHGIETHTCRAGAWDLSTPSGRAVARTLGAWARYESEHKGDRITRAHLRSAEAGTYRGGGRPFGFESDGVTVRPDEAAVIAEVTDHIVAGVSLRQITRDLNTRGITTARGKTWTSASVKALILRPRNAGLSQYRGEIMGPAAWAPLVPEDVWTSARRILTDESRRTAPETGGAVRWLGSGLYKCGVCGSGKVRVSAGSDGRRVYRCQGSMDLVRGQHITRSAKHLDEFVSAVLVGRLADPAILSAIDAETKTADTGELHAARANHRRKMDEAADLFSEGAIDGRQLSRITERERAAIDAIDAELAEVSSSSALSVLGGVSASEVAGKWAALDLGAQRAILDTLVTVTILPTSRKGAGFDPAGVKFEWKGANDG